jgi:Ferritin-like
MRHRQERFLSFIGPNAGSTSYTDVDLAELPGEATSELRTPLTRIPADIGLTKPDELTWWDWAVFLLHTAAEIEHALMVQYLYAAFSLGEPPFQGPNVPSTAQTLVNRWRGTILGIAKEEMGHLITVQNLLRFIGGALNSTLISRQLALMRLSQRFRVRMSQCKRLATFSWVGLSPCLCSLSTAARSSLSNSSADFHIPLPLGRPSTLSTEKSRHHIAHSSTRPVRDVPSRPRNEYAKSPSHRSSSPDGAQPFGPLSPNISTTECFSTMRRPQYASSFPRKGSSPSARQGIAFLASRISASLPPRRPGVGSTQPTIWLPE